MRNLETQCSPRTVKAARRRLVREKIEMCAAVGCLTPAISRKQVVLPEPDGPSIAKKRALSNVQRLQQNTAADGV